MLLANYLNTHGRKHYRPSSAYNAPFWTTNYGAPVYNNDSSLTVGTRGPILLEDYHFVEKLANFDRERIPERVVHARGASAKGFFEVTHDISALTCADFLRAPGVQTPVIVRFSTVIHERGSPETLRDPRGFAVKFYTREGNFDLVGNNFPVFFIRDGMKFPDMVHSLKPNPKSHIQEDWRILDFFSHHPESLHMFTFLQDDVGVPQDYRHMDGSGVNTYTLINKTGKTHYVKFHWRPTCGVKCLLEDEAIKVGGTNHSHATKDLYDSIADGNYPEWKLFIQTMDPDHEDRFDFDPLDVTKTWPEDILPLQPVGRMVLNKNIDNFFAENEQLAFCPAIIVPGIYYSDDKLLQTRIFSYADTQRHRLGPNYLQLPANAPKCAHHNNHHDGFMNFMHRDEEVNYFPSRYDPVRHAEQYPIPPVMLSGKRNKCVIEKENNFKQPGERYRSWDPDRQERFICRIVGALSDPRVTHEVRTIWVSYWSQADKSLGQKIASRLNVKPSY
ncbi:putative peroxidase [Helianthus annuus]|nr:putative peroxidase [Helianthus annuus]